MILSNYHTHTVYCDGLSTADEHAEAAVAAGFRYLGFSGHGYAPFPGLYHGMSPENAAKYRNEINSLKPQYRGRLDIFCGLENDSVNMQPAELYDYTIGSVHCIKIGARYYSVDSKAGIVADAISREFGGDGIAFAEAYFDAVREFATEKRADIMGHFDLVRRFNTPVNSFSSGAYVFFDENSERYRSAALSALERAVRSGYIIEVSTATILKKISNETYPANFLLQRANELGARVIVNSDAHAAANLNYAFGAAEEALRKAGFTERWELTPGGFAAAPV